MKKLSLLLISFFIVTCFFLISCKNEKVLSGKKYIFKKLFEVPISTDTHDSLLSIYHSNFKYTKDYYLVTPTEFSPTQFIPGPVLLMIDPDTNFYIANAYENIKVFNKSGKFIYKFEYPNDFRASSHYMDENRNVFILLMPGDQNEKKKIVYKINWKQHIESLLSDSETSQLQSGIFNPQNYLERKKKEQGTGKIYFDAIWGTAMRSILTNENGRFIEPKSLNVYRFDTSYNINLNYNIPDKYLYDSLIISNYFNDKVVDISSTKIDKNGNIYISGVRSNEVERIKLDYDRREIDAIKVYSPKFFLCEFERR
jgi:hypothetical protein